MTSCRVPSHNYTSRKCACDCDAQTVHPDCKVACKTSDCTVREVYPWQAGSSANMSGPQHSSCTQSGAQQHTDWNLTTSSPTTGGSLLRIPSPLPWNVYMEQQENCTSAPNCHWPRESTPNSTAVFGPVPSSKTPLWPPSSTRAVGVCRATKPNSCHSMYPNADLLSQHCLTLLRQVFPEHTTAALQHVLDRCGGDIISALENILACHAYKDHLLKTCASILAYQGPGARTGFSCRNTRAKFTPPKQQTTDQCTTPGPQGSAVTIDGPTFDTV